MIEKKVIITDIDWDKGSGDKTVPYEVTKLPETVEIDDEDLYDKALIDPDGFFGRLTSHLSDRYGYDIRDYTILRPLPESRAMELLNSVINDISCAENTSDTLKSLIRLGFTDKELTVLFGFQTSDVAHAFNSYEENAYLSA